MIFVQKNLFWVLIFIWFMYVAFLLLYYGYLAWRVPNELKRRYSSGAEKWPEWFPFREYYIHFYNSDNFVYLMRLVTLMLTIGMAFFLYMLVDSF